MKLLISLFEDLAKKVIEVHGHSYGELAPEMDAIATYIDNVENGEMIIDPTADNEPHKMD